VVATATGDFDLVTFDPTNADRLLASRRSSYGPAENQSVNERWRIGDGYVDQRAFDPDRAHDFAHFTGDGSVAVWAHSGNNTAFASRTVSIERGTDTLETAPIYASRSVVVDDVLFALTGSADYYSTTRHHESFVAHRGDRVIVLDSGEAWSWVDSPAPGVAVTYPVDPGGTTKAWDTSTLEAVADHALSGLSYRRLTISADGSAGIGVTFDGELEHFDPSTGDPIARFGGVDPEGISAPVTLNADGSMAITVDRLGEVRIWWVGDDEPLAIIDADAGPARVLGERRAPRRSSAVHPGAERVAVRLLATPRQATSWLLLDTNPTTWVRRACADAGRTFTADERQTLGLTDTKPACP
jgi:hypothetical protein